MGNDAYQLQGRNGVDVVGAGQTFTGRSAGLLVTDTATFDFEVVKPNGSDTATFSSAERPIGFFPGGTVTQVTVTSGEIAVYPESTVYTIA